MQAEHEHGRRRRSRTRTVLGSIGLVVLTIFAAILALALIPSSSDAIGANPKPASSYVDALGRFETIARAERGSGVYEPCRSRLLGDGRRADVAVVLVHGLTNCPRQFVEFGEQLHAAGANVLILRIPRHGLADASGRKIGGVGNVGGLTAAELAGYGDEAVDIADGLGEDVRVLGLSMGGVVAAWIAQNRADVDRVVAVAPAISLPHVPGVVDYMFRNLFGRVPNVSLPSSGVLDHAYSGESTRALASMYRLAHTIQEQAEAERPAAGSIVVVTNANDNQVNNGDIGALAGTWREQGAVVREYEFPARLGLPHDVIDVQQPTGKPDQVYPVLGGLLGFGG